MSWLKLRPQEATPSLSAATSVQTTSHNACSRRRSSALATTFPFIRPLMQCCRKYGKLNHIVNNAGFTFDRMLHTTPDDAWDIIQKVHVRAPFRLIRAAAPYMRIKVRPRPPSCAQHRAVLVSVVDVRAQGNKENRSIINVSSTSGLHGNIGQANYAAAKSAVVGLTKTICKEWGIFNVRANTIAYGYVMTRCVSVAVL